MLQRIIERVRRSRRTGATIVATSDTHVDQPIVELCASLGVDVHCGSETDVLGRILGAAERFDADAIVRLTGDNPMVDGALVDYAIKEFETARASRGEGIEYLGNADDCGFPYGLFVEVATVDGLRRSRLPFQPDVNEHVTLRLRRSGSEHVVHLRSAASFSVKSVTVDTAEDYVAVRALFEQLYAKDPNFSYTALLKSKAKSTVRR